MAHPWHWQTPEPDDHLFVPVDRLAAAASKRDPDPTWRRTTWGRYVPTSTSTSVEQRILNQAARLGPRQAVTGWAALRLWGAGLFDGCGPDGVTEVPVPLAVGADGQLDQHLGGVISYVRLPAQDVRDLNGFAVATVARAVFDEVRRVGGIRAGVGVIDTAVGAGVTTLPDLARWTAGRAGWKGVKRMRASLPLARAGVRSPRETGLRLTLELDLGILGIVANHVVHHRRPDGTIGRRICEVDLLDLKAGLVCEFDGADHRSAQQQTIDLAHQEELERAGLVVARFTGSDTVTPGMVRRRATSKRATALFLPPDERRWVALPPKPRINTLFRRRLAAARFVDW